MADTGNKLKHPPRILVADDEPSIRMMLETGLTLNGFEVKSARTGREALDIAASEHFDAVLSDVYMPDLGGLELVDEFRLLRPGMPIVLMTAQGSLEAAVDAVSRGATDFIGKPFDIADVVKLLRRYLEARREADTSSGVQIADSDFSRSGLIGRSAPMVMVYKLIAQAARTDATVLITGQSGTGKELVARAIHDLSDRRGRAFLSVNCSGLTDTLLESELFGHTRGAFTGSAGDHAGLFEAANGGTLFLDELASTTGAFQASLLRVLQSGEVRRVGSTQVRTVDVRVIAASNTPLRQLIDAGEFRADLFYRLSVLSIELPPLRERQGDIELLSSHFLQRFRAEEPAYVSREALEALSAYDYPGNVRELENALRSAVALSSNGLITIDCLPPEIVACKESAPAGFKSRSLIADRPSMNELQRRYLEFILEESGWNRRRAAAVLELDRRTIQRLIARYQLQSAADTEVADMDAEEASVERPLHNV